MSDRARQVCPQCGSDDVVIGDVTSFCNHCGEVFQTDEETRRRVAKIIPLPIAPRRNWHDPAWREQVWREEWGNIHNEASPPPRTRPLIVGYRPEAK